MSRPSLRHRNRIALALSALLVLPAALAATPATAAEVAGAPGSRCGYVSNVQGIVPRSEDIFGVEITRIDGESTPLDVPNRHRLEPGTHVLMLSDRIQAHRLPSAANAQIAKMKKLERQRAYRQFTLEVEPGVSYAIGARVLRDRLDADSIRANEYWEPVVWDRRAEPCQ